MNKLFLIPVTESIVQAAFCNISQEHCKGWFSDCGYM